MRDGEQRRDREGEGLISLLLLLGEGSCYLLLVYYDMDSLNLQRKMVRWYHNSSVVGMMIS